MELFPATHQYVLEALGIEYSRGGVEVAERGDLGSDSPPRSVQVQGVGS